MVLAETRTDVGDGVPHASVMARLEAAEARRRLLATFRWGGDQNDPREYADRSGWWRDADVLSSIGPALSELFAHQRPTLVLGIESSGMLVGPLVALQLGVGFVAGAPALGWTMEVAGQRASWSSPPCSRSNSQACAAGRDCCS